MPDSNNYRKNKAAARRIEAVLNLKPPTPKPDTDRIGTSDKTATLQRKANRKGTEMINTKQLVKLVRDAENAAKTPKHMQELLLASGVLVDYRWHVRDNLVIGWKLRADDSPETDWLKGSEITSDRHFTWSKVARRKGWPLPNDRAAGGLLAQVEQDDEQPIAPLNALDFLQAPEVTKPKSVRECDQEMAAVLEELTLLVARLAHFIQQLVVRLVNSLLRAAGVDYQLQVRPGSMPGRLGSGQAQDAKREASLHSVRALVSALKNQDPDQLPAAPAGDADASEARAALASELKWQRWLATSQPSELERAALGLEAQRSASLLSPIDRVQHSTSKTDVWFDGLAVKRQKALTFETDLLKEIVAHTERARTTPAWNLMAQAANRKKIAELKVKAEAARVARVKADREFDSASRTDEVQNSAARRRDFARHLADQKRLNDARLEQVRARLAQLKVDAKALQLRQRIQPLDELAIRQTESEFPSVERAEIERPRK